ncbi:MAG: hypothetical protein ACFCVF_14070 [Kineosporiaceae bacterium]
MAVTRPPAGSAPEEAHDPFADNPFAVAVCHDVLLQVAGRAPDDLLATARAWVADGRLLDVARAVTFAALTYRVPLPEESLLGLADLLSAGGVDPLVLRQAEVVVSDLAPPFLFGSDRHDRSADDDVNEDPRDAAAVSAATDAAARGLWRSWRRPADGSPWPEERRVYVVEVSDPDARAATAATVARALAAAGETVPLVECYATGQDLPAYTRLARAAGSLLWAASPEREILVADVFDRIDDDGQPSFDTDHPVVDDPDERQRLAAYLDAGAVLLTTTSLAVDVLDPDQRPVVPMTFRTDGTWVWTDALTYYLREHGIRPQQDLMAHLGEVAGGEPRVDGVDVHRAMAVISS